MRTSRAMPTAESGETRRLRERRTGSPTFPGSGCTPTADLRAEVGAVRLGQLQELPPLAVVVARPQGLPLLAVVVGFPLI